MTVYRLGSIGNQVRQIQTALGIKVDGIFGKGTETAVREFQKKNGLFPDGIVGKKTLDMLMSKMDTDMTCISRPSAVLGIRDNYLPKNEYLNGRYSNEYIVLHHTAGGDDPKAVIDSWGRDSIGRVATEFVIGGQRCTDGRSTFDGQIYRAFPEGNQAYHIGASGSSYMNTHSVGIEMCNMGWVKNGRTYTNTIVRPDQTVTTAAPFRGYSTWHRYSDRQLRALRSLLIYISNRDGIDLHKGIYNWIKTEGPAKAFEFHQDAYYGKVKGLITHANIRKDKFDVSPQPELIDMILTL